MIAANNLDIAHVTAGSPLEGNQSAEGESWITKAWREGQLLMTGINGFGKAANEAFTNHPWQTLGEFALSAGIGYGIARCAPARGLGGALVAVGELAMGSAFTLDVLGNGSKVAGALYDNLQSDRNWQANVSIMENGLGKFCFDTVLTSVGGATGALGHHVPNLYADLQAKLSSVQEGSGKLASGRLSLNPANVREIREPGGLQTMILATDKHLNPDGFYREVGQLSDSSRIAVPQFAAGSFGVKEPSFILSHRDSGIGKYYLDNRPSIVRIVGQQNPSVSSVGTGFFVNENGMIATNNHVISGLSQIHVETSDGAKYFVRALSRDRLADLALLQVLNKPNQVRFRPLELARTSSLGPNAFLGAIGHPAGVPQEVLTMGQYSGFSLESERPLLPGISFDPTPRVGDIVSNIPIRKGYSGSPLLSQDGKVVGVLKADTDNNQSIATSVEHLNVLIKETEARNPNGWLDVHSVFDHNTGAAFKLGLPTEKMHFPIDAGIDPNSFDRQPRYFESINRRGS